ncbi:MAG: energy transducer TonB [Prochloraceae cyanobacterium]
MGCISKCLPVYPSVLNGAEGSATVRIIVNRQGNVIDASIVSSNSNSEIDRQALIAAKNMRFSPFKGQPQASARVKINFTVAGSRFDRDIRQR